MTNHAEATVATVWCPNWGHDEADGTVIPVVDRLSIAMQVEDAAEAYAEKKFDSGDPFHNLDVVVKIAGKEYKASVDVEAVPQFSAAVVD